MDGLMDKWMNRLFYGLMNEHMNGWIEKKKHMSYNMLMMKLIVMFNNTCYSL